MKSLAALFIAIIFATGCATPRHSHRNDQTKLRAEARITKDAATQTALARVPNGTVKSAELERENGKLIWSFDVSMPGSNDITEVNVDAVSGEVVSTSRESPESESKEKD